MVIKELYLDHFDPTFVQNLRSDWIHFVSCAELSY